MKRIVFWQNIPSIHQAPLIREVARLSECETVVVAQGDISQRRRSQGWTRPDFGKASLIIEPEKAVQDKLLTDSAVDTVHIFSGIHAYPLVRRALRQAAATEATIGIYAEGQRPEGWKGLLRMLRSKLNARIYGERIDFILAVGETGVRWYRRSGFSEEKLFPFGYFVDPSPSVASTEPEMGGPFKFICVCELSPHKGVDILLRAVARLPRSSWLLYVVGDGQYRHRYEMLAKKLRLSSNVRWCGVLNNLAVRKMIAMSDLLVLPSRYDGWGAVVNEALLSDTPVVCSDACGAADAVRTTKAGTVVEAGSVDALGKALMSWMSRGRTRPEYRRELQKWAAQRLGPDVGARYLLDIIGYVRKQGDGCRPVAPWRK